MRHILIILVALFSLGQCLAATYYVDQQHSQAADSNPGTISQPWKTVQKAFNTMSAGDTTRVKAGNYSSASVTASKSGTKGGHIVLQAAPGELATLGPVKVDGSYITVEGFQITNFPGWPTGLVQVTSFGR